MNITKGRFRTSKTSQDVTERGGGENIIFHHPTPGGVRKRRMKGPRDARKKKGPNMSKEATSNATGIFGRNRGGKESRGVKGDRVGEQREPRRKKEMANSNKSLPSYVPTEDRSSGVGCPVRGANSGLRSLCHIISTFRLLCPRRCCAAPEVSRRLTSQSRSFSWKRTKYKRRRAKSDLIDRTEERRVEVGSKGC